MSVEKKLRELLWLRHGCDLGRLYGDDGEMQCNKCMIDFKRDDPLDIQKRFKETGILYCHKRWKEKQK